MKKNLHSSLIIIFMLAAFNYTHAEDGYRLWLKYELISDASLLNEYSSSIQAIMFEGESETIQIAKKELTDALSKLLGKSIPRVDKVNADGIIIAGTFNKIQSIQNSDLKDKLEQVGEEGFVISTGKLNNKNVIVITANKDIGVLYGVFNFLKLLQTHKDIDELDIVTSPKMKLRMLNHWDMLDGTHEYDGLLSIWEWLTLPTYIRTRYIDYARANASIGINATSLNCVDADPKFLTEQVLIKYAALADLFRPYGIKVFMSPNFSAPIKLGGMETADPDVPEVKEWWRKKVKEIYEHIPDFGGFLVKANSEDEPGPGDFGKSQAAGANMFAEVLKPYNGLVIWRTFVYDYAPEDRAREAYDIFKPLDEIFADNVILQVKNGPLDFTPREPFTPLFGAMPNTALLMEIDISLGGLGKSVNLAYMGPMWLETLAADTYAKGKRSTVAKVIDGSLHNYKMSGMAGVANVYLDNNWTGNIFSQANWFIMGRLAWDYNTTSDQMADDWIRMAFSNDAEIIEPVKKIMMESREHIVNYMNPLGLNMLMGWGGNRGPWVNNSEHATWNSPYYHRADRLGIGFDRTKTRSTAVDQYYPPVAQKFASLETCPEEYILWFHHVSWTYKMNSGNTLWDELCHHYYEGVEGVIEMQRIWNSLEEKIDREQFESVNMLLKIQHDDAVTWRDGCVLYFQTFSNLPIPEGLEKPEHELEYYMIHDPR